MLSSEVGQEALRIGGGLGANDIGFWYASHPRLSVPRIDAARREVFGRGQARLQHTRHASSG